jgi:acid phosphatase
MKRFILISCLLAAQAVAAPLPRPDHIVIVIEENKGHSAIIGNRDAAYINALAASGALFTQSYAITHPSQPNYLALFAGTTFGLSSDACPLELVGDNLASVLLAKKRSFAVYSESLPGAGAPDCRSGAYHRKHNPLANWAELAAYNLPFSAFPQAFSRLPTVALVVPNQRNDMHDGTVAEGDAWLRENIGPYAEWAIKHNSLLILTWDEGDAIEGNRVATIFVGAMVKRGQSAQRINHYNVLRTIEEMYRLPYLNESAQASAITGIWRVSARPR